MLRPMSNTDTIIIYYTYDMLRPMSNTDTIIIYYTYDIHAI